MEKLGSVSRLPVLSNARGPSPSKRLYSDCNNETKPNTDEVLTLNEGCAKIPRGTVTVFDLEPFLQRLEEESGATVLEAKRKLKQHLDELYPQEESVVKLKLLRQFDYCFVRSHKTKFEKYKEWVLTSGEFEVPAQFSRTSSPSNAVATASTGVNPEKASNAAIIDDSSGTCEVSGEKLDAQVGEAKRMAAELADRLKDLRAMRIQEENTLRAKTEEARALFSALCEQRLYLSVMRLPAAFCQDEGQSNEAKRKGGTSDQPANQRKQGLFQIEELRSALNGLIGAVKNRQVLGFEIKDLTPLFPNLFPKKVGVGAKQSVLASGKMESSRAAVDSAARLAREGYSSMRHRSSIEPSVVRESANRRRESIPTASATGAAPSDGVAGTRSQTFEFFSELMQ